MTRARDTSKLVTAEGAEKLGIGGGRTQADKNAEFVSVKDFGAVGDNTTDDTAAISAALDYVLSFDRPPKLHVPPGLYKVTRVLPSITKPLTIEGDNPRASMFMFSGSASSFKIAGVGNRAADVKVRNLGINGAAMTNGYAVEIDFAQDIVFENVLIADPYNGVYIRQAGVIKFNDCLIDKVRGPYGVLAYGESVARNGENDQIDILAFHNTVIQGVYVPGVTTSVAELLVLDGRVHTVQINGLRLLSAKRGLVTKNTPGVAINFCPRFITGDALEIESMVNECADFQYCVDFWVDGFFAAGSDSADGVLLGANVSNWNVDKGSISSNWLAGVNIGGAKDVTITSLLVYNNARAGVNSRSGIAIGAGSGTIDIRGGLAGKATWLPAYTENQKYGIDLNAAYGGAITIDAVDVRGNSTKGIYTAGTSAAIGSSVQKCAGFNPTGASLHAVGASPYSYTAGLAQEAVTLYGGTGVVVTVDGIALTNTTPASFVLAPRKTAVISYVTAPTMAINGM